MQGPTESNPCPRCAQENTADTNFCGNCGLHIDGTCPLCLTNNVNSTHFCGNCGYDFAPPITQATPHPSSTPAAYDLRSQQTSFSAGALAQPQYQAPAIDCPRCHHINEPGAVFCFNCGLPFDRATGFRQGNPTGSIRAYIGAAPGGFWVRFAAFLIDGIVTTAAVSILITIFTDISPADYMSSETGLTHTGADFINWTFNLAYAPMLLRIWSTTVGKRAFNMYVVKLDGSPIGFWRALGREVAKVISAIPLFAGFWLVAFRDDKRALHDLIAGTAVIQRD